MLGGRVGGAVDARRHGARTLRHEALMIMLFNDLWVFKRFVGIQRFWNSVHALRELRARQPFRLNVGSEAGEGGDGGGGVEGVEDVGSGYEDVCPGGG